MITVPEELDKTFKTSFTQGVTLPFEAPSFWWINGQANADKSHSGVPFYGGWATDADALVESNIAIPKSLIPEQYYTKDGKVISTFMTRYLPMTLVGKRSRWKESTTGGKGTMQTQYLVLLAQYGADKVFRYWTPAVITVKGYINFAFADANRDFDKFTAQARKLYANGASALFFWRMIGTFGNERNQTMVGKKGLQSPITPCTVLLPKEEIKTEAELAKYFIGNDTIAILKTVIDGAQDWLKAWENNMDKNYHNDNNYPEEPPLPDMSELM